MGYRSAPHSLIILGMSHKWSLSQLLKYISVNYSQVKTTGVLQTLGDEVITSYTPIVRQITYKLILDP